MTDQSMEESSPVDTVTMFSNITDQLVHTSTTWELNTSRWIHARFLVALQQLQMLIPICHSQVRYLMAIV